jgi:hypothetical protein
LIWAQPTAELNLLMNVGLGVNPASSIAAASMTGFGASYPFATNLAKVGDLSRNRPQPFSMIMAS